MRMELEGRRRDPVVVQELGWVRFCAIKKVKEIEEVKGESTEGKTGAGNLLWRRNHPLKASGGGELRRDRIGVKRDRDLPIFAKIGRGEGGHYL